MKKKLLSFLLATTMVATLATGCGEAATADTGADEPAATTETTEETTTAGGDQTVGIAMPTQSLERWNRDGSFLEEQFKSKGYEVKLTYSDKIFPSVSLSLSRIKMI